MGTWIGENEFLEHGTISGDMNLHPVPFYKADDLTRCKSTKSIYDRTFSHNFLNYYKWKSYLPRLSAHTPRHPITSQRLLLSIDLRCCRSPSFAFMEQNSPGRSLKISPAIRRAGEMANIALDFITRLESPALLLWEASSNYF
ncbi:hypothetical protein CEXT_402051 [Caerostris extrusa]|uniref:Uncharacterized protein n=1 Tax=Caerostris extrusa TaxID=172846 RepID=A0AAV4W6U2_CAEEX|nr:hypothetical protein CEXT_402051 [Caerostris extrusa]